MNTRDLCSKPRKENELSVLAAHLGEKEVAFQRYAASLQQQIAEQKRSYESLRAYVVEREQRIAELDELLRRRAGPLGIVAERAAYQVKRTYPKVRLQVYRVGRRARDVVRRLRRS